MAAVVGNSQKRSINPPSAPLHPNPVDRKRIEKSLARRTRYRYVRPRVLDVENGYQIVSPCCSRNVDKNGGEIAIARIEFGEQGFWQLYRHDHDARSWVQFGEYLNLQSLLDPLLKDWGRIFWQ